MKRNNVELIGFHNPDVNYPAFVNPIIKRDSKIYIYLEKDPRTLDGFMKPPSSVNYVAWAACPTFDPATTGLIALSKHELYNYPLIEENKFLQKLLDKKEFSNNDPVRRFAFAEIAYETHPNKKQKLLQELRNATQHPKFTELNLLNWYTVESNRLGVIGKIKYD